MAVSSSPSELTSAGRAAVSMLRAGWWPDAIDRLDEILEVAFAVSRDGREVDEAVDALREAALGLRDDAEKPERRENVTAQRIQDLAVLTEDVAEAARRTGHEPSDEELREAERHLGPPPKAKSSQRSGMRPTKTH